MSEDIDRISPFFIGKNILISGGSGFVGKVFIEKILRSCPNIGTVFVLIRVKNGKDPNERLEEIFESPIFLQMKVRMGPFYLPSKVKVITGDMSLLGLGLTIEDRQRLVNNVHIIYNFSAVVRFNEPLKKAILTNTRGTREMLNLARQCKSLELFVHLSTAYAYPNQKVLKEEHYDPPAEPHRIISLAETFGEEEIDKIAKTLMHDYPNTYSFSKALAEGLVNEAMSDISAIIIRPSIITPVMFSPVAGWTDNMFGMTGVFLGGASGILRIMHGDPDVVSDFVPVDILTNAICVATFNYVQLKDHQHTVLHVVSGPDVRLTYRENIKLILNSGRKNYPFDYVLWYPNLSFTKSYVSYKIQAFFLHWIPAYIVDFLLTLFAYPRALVKIHNKISSGIDVLNYYTNNHWEFCNENLGFLRRLVNKTEAERYFIFAEGIDIPKYMEDISLSSRRYILKNGDDTIPRAKKVVRGLYFADKLLKLLLIMLSTFIIYKLLSSTDILSA